MIVRLQNIFILFFLIICFYSNAQQNKTVKKTTNPSTKTTKSNPKSKTKPSGISSVSDKEKQIMQNRMDYDLYSTLDNKAPSNILMDLYPMYNPTLPNALNITSKEINASLEEFKSSLIAKFEKSNSFITINGKPQPAPHHIVLTAKAKSFPYRKIVSLKLNISNVKDENGQIMKLLMEDTEYKKANANALLTTDSSFTYGVNVKYAENFPAPKSISGTINFNFPTKFFTATVKKSDYGKVFTIGSVKIKIVSFKNNTFAFEVTDPQNSLNWIVLNENNMEFSKERSVSLTPEQYQLYKKTKIRTDNTIDSLGTVITDWKSDVRVNHCKVFGTGNITKVIFYTIEASEPKELKFEIDEIENKVK